MISFLVIYGAPARQFYINRDAVDYLNPAQAKHGILLDLGDLQSGVAGENANISVALDNSAGQCTRLFAAPPVGAKAIAFSVIAGVAVSQFSGVIQSIELDAEKATLQVEA